MGAYSVLKQHEKAHEDAIWSVCWASQNQLLTGSLDTTAILWKLHNQSGETRLTVDTVHEGFCLGVVSIDMAPKSSIAAVAAMDCKIRLLDLDKPVESREIMKIDASPVESWKVKFSPSGKHIATGGLSGKINMYSLENMESAPTKTQFDVGKFAYSVDFSPDGKLLAAGNVDGIINIFDLETQRLLTQIDAHAMPIRALSFSPDSKTFISGSDDTQIKIHNTNGEQIKALSGHASWILDLSFSPNGQHFASSSTDKKVKIWDTTTHECIQTFTNHTHQVTGVRYDPNGSRLASVSEDNTIVIYDYIK